jgi:glycosyltransferase involved in cell wall biosynthesis
LALGHRIRRLLAIGHSYCVALNRRLPNEMARVGSCEWSVTAVAPKFFYGDLGPIRTEARAEEISALVTVPALFSRHIHFFTYGRKLAELLRQSWDVIHCWEEPYILAGGQVALLTPYRTPLVFWTAQSTPKHYPPPFSIIESYCLSRCAGWMARGQTGLDALLSRGYGRKPHRAVPLGVDTELFRPDPAAREQTRMRLDWSNSGGAVIGYVGRFVEEKGVQLLTRTLDRLNSSWRALFVGGGPLERYLHAWSARYRDRVRIVTGVSHDRVPEYLNAIDLLCAPSQTRSNWREVFGRMLVEAFACGVPVIASDSGEIPHVVADAGIIVPESDEDAWIQRVGEVLENPRLQRDLSQRGLERARTEYSWAVVAHQHLEFLDELLQAQ